MLDIPGLVGGTRFTFLDPVETYVDKSPESVVPGLVSVQAPVGPRPVGALACAQLIDEVKVTFALTESYEALEIARDGIPIATLAGSATEFSEALPYLGRIEYSVSPRSTSGRACASTS